MESVMKSLLTTKLKWSEEKVDEMTEKYINEHDLCKYLLSPNQTAVNWSGYPYHIRATFVKQEYLLYFASLGWNGLTPKMIEEISIFELEVMKKRSPFYAMTTFGISYESCVELAVKMKKNLPDDVRAYNLVYRELCKGKMVTVEDVKRKFPNVTGCITEVHPFGSDVLHNHPLELINPACTAEANMKHLVHGSNDLISKIRERKNMVNKISRKNNVYMHQNNTDVLLSMIKDMIDDKKSLRVTV